MSTNIFSYSNHNIDLVSILLVTKNSLDNPCHYKCFYQASLHRLLRIKGFILVLIGGGAALPVQGDEHILVTVVPSTPPLLPHLLATISCCRHPPFKDGGESGEVISEGGKEGGSP